MTLRRAAKAARGKSGVRRGVRRNRGVYLRRHVLDRLQHVEFEIETLHLVRQRLRRKAVAQIIFLLGADLLQRVRADVMIRDEQAVRTHEATGAAGIEAHGRLLQMLQPRLSEVELMPILEQLARWLVEEPHAFIRERADGQKAGQQGREEGLCHKAKAGEKENRWRGES